MRASAIYDVPWFAPVMACVVATAGLFFIWQNKFSSLSVDVAWHYSLVEHYFDGLVLGSYGTKPVNMDGYPPVSHFFGAVLGWFLNSPFKGMKCAALLYVCAIYGFLFEAARSRDHIVTGVCFSLILVFLFLLRHFQLLYGSEILGNFFYAQAGGQALTFAALFALSRAKQSWGEIFLVPALVFVCGWIYTLAQLQILAGVLFLLFCRMAQGWRMINRPPVEIIWKIGIVLLLGGTAIRFHPTYELMRVIANNEGGDTNHALSLPTLAWLAALLIVLSVALWLTADARGRLAHPLFLAATGGAAAIAFAVHYGAFVLIGAGSAYGIRKHTFSLVSLILVSGTVLIIRLVVVQLHPQVRKSFSFFSLIAVGLATTMSVWIMLNWGMIASQAFEELQREVRIQLAHFPDMAGKTVSRLSGLSVGQNFVVTLVDLKVRDAVAIRHTLTEDRSLSDIKYVIVDDFESLDPHCVVKRFAASALVDSACRR